MTRPRRFTAPVLMFHHVVPDAAALDPPPLHRNSYLDRRAFAALLDALAARRCHTLTLGDAAQRTLAGRRLPRRSVVLTFDDGCRCFRDEALPELAARGMTATLFAVSGELGGTNRWDRPAAGPGERREELLTAQALRQVAAAGIEIGAHGRHHRDLTECDDAALRDEVAGSREELAGALGEAVCTFCYPYGRLDARVRAAVREAGYLAAAAIHGHGGERAGDLMALARHAVNPGDSRFELLLKASGFYPMWSRLPRVGLLAGLRARRRTHRDRKRATGSAAAGSTSGGSGGTERPAAGPPR